MSNFRIGDKVIIDNLIDNRYGISREMREYRDEQIILKIVEFKKGEWERAYRATSGYEKEKNGGYWYMENNLKPVLQGEDDKFREVTTMKAKYETGQKVRVKKNFRQIPALTNIGNIPNFYDGSIITLGQPHIGYDHEVSYYMNGKTNKGRDTIWIFAEQWLEPVEISEDDKFKEQLLNI